MKRAIFAALSLAMALAFSTRAQEDKNAATLEEARQHVQKAKVHYDLGEFKEAAEEYINVYRLRPIPAILFNVAQAYRQAGLYEKARQFYKSYLRESPDAKNKAMIEQAIREMDDLLAKEKHAKEAAPTGVKEPPAEAVPPKAQAQYVPPPKPPEAKPAETVAQKPPEAQYVPPPKPPETKPVETVAQKPPETKPAETVAQKPPDKAATKPEPSKPAATVAMAPAKASPAPAPHPSAPVAATSAPAPAPVAEEEGSILTKWWLWTAVGVVAVGAGVAATQMGGNAAPGSHFGTTPVFP
jgi:hypothetical protein